MLNVLLSVLVWYAYIAGAACAAILIAGALNGRSRKAQPRPVVRYIAVPALSTEQPRRVSIVLATGGVELLWPDTEPVVHTDGGNIMDHADRSWTR